MKKSFLNFILLLLIGSNGVLNAEEVLIRWKGDYVTSLPQPRLNLGEVASLSNGNGSPNKFLFRLPEGQAMVPEARYDREAPSAIFYGMLDVTRSAEETLEQDVRNASQLVRRDGGRGCLMRFGVSPAQEGETAGIRGLIYWDQSGFASQAVAQRSINSSEIVALEMDIVSLTSRVGQGHVRFAMRSQGQWYLSENSTMRTGTFAWEPGTYWAKWPRSDDASALSEVPEDFSIPLEGIGVVEAVGFFFDAHGESGGACGLDRFEVTVK